MSTWQHEIAGHLRKRWTAKTHAHEKFTQINMNNSTLATVPPQLRKNRLPLVLLMLGLLVWLLPFTLGLAGYSGSKALYVLFSIVTGIMLVTGFQKMTGYGYLFLTIFLWLGFWLKLTIHTILSYPFVEPVGSFVGSAQAWDEVLFTATVASLGVILGKLLYNQIKSRFGAMHGEIKPVVPPWYANSRKWLWAGLMVTGATVLLVNLKYGIHQIGLAPRTILMWPLNAGIAWLLNIGLATGITVLLWWDIALKKNLTVPIYAIIAEALVSSVSILSRAAYVFHAIPQLWAAHRFKHTFKGWSHAKTGLLVAIFALLLVVSISAVTTFRNYLYQSGAYLSTAYQVAYARSEALMSAIAAEQLKIKNSSPAERVALEKRVRELLAEKLKLDAIAAKEKAKSDEAMKSGSAQSKVLLNEFGYQITGGSSTLMLQLSVDRWIGLEGLMAVQSYPEKNRDLLWQALNEKPEAGKPDIYQTVSDSIYLKSDGTKFRFATLPGAAAFLYYSGSLLIVLLGMVFFSLAVLVIEFVINALTANPILCSLYGAVIASNVAQFGGSPQLSLPYFLMLACGILLVWIVQTRLFTQVLHKLKLLNTAQPRDD
ncbi:hypothetical protein [Polaromonas sp.]|uniref:hypothetical protein n=1 Tax=Polaromonas sp. TaxID=1869339 RepID=UPI002FCA0C44